MPDATAELIRDLDDPAKYERVADVPVFRAHVREFPEVRDAAGKVVQPKRVVKVTDADLYQIADRLNAEIRKTGYLRPLTIGHRHFAPDFPEQHQAPLVGFARDEYRVGWVQRDGDRFLAVLETEYVMKGERDALRKYPYRSIDYDPDRGTSEGTALLVRPPFLKMGTTIQYQYDGGTTVPDTPTPTPAPDKQPDADDFSPQDVAAYERCYRYFKLKKYVSEAAGPTNAEPPTPVKNQVGDGSGNQRGQEQAMNMKDEGKSKYQSPALPVPAATPGEVVGYAAELAAIRQQLAEERSARVTAECKSMLDPFRDVIKFDYPKELATLATLPSPEARAAHVKYMAEHYAPLPTAGGMIATYAGTDHLPRPDDKTPSIFKEPDRHAEVMEYMGVQHAAGRSCQYHEAKAAVLAKYAK